VRSAGFLLSKSVACDGLGVLDFGVADERKAIVNLHERRTGLRTTRGGDF
jgi:hypothetical protein